MLIEPGEALPGRPGVSVTVLADSEHLWAGRFRLGPEAGGAGAHIHRDHADCFLVLEGTLRMRLGDTERDVTAGTWVHVPPGVVHGYAPASGQVAFLDVHAPSCGFGAYLRGLVTESDPAALERVRAAFDQHPPPDDAGTGGDALVVPLGGDAGETITRRPSRRVTLLSDTDGIAATESVYGPGEVGPEPHVHHHHTDAWLVLEGALTFTLRDGQPHEVPAGTFVVVPPDVIHSFANRGAVPARFLNLHAPSCGFGAYLRGVHPGFDQHPAPAEGGLDPVLAVARTLA